MSLPEYYKISEFIRNIGHFIEFGVFGVFIYLLTDLHTNRTSTIVLGICALYAASDEIHQIFVAGRGVSIIDWIIDCVGASIGILITYLLANCIKKAKGRRCGKKDRGI